MQYRPGALPSHTDGLSLQAMEPGDVWVCSSVQERVSSGARFLCSTIQGSRASQSIEQYNGVG